MHCMTGRSKSVVAVAAYLMVSERVAAEEALRRVCGCHPGSKVTEEHQNLLSEFQGALAAS